MLAHQNLPKQQSCSAFGTTAKKLHVSTKFHHTAVLSYCPSPARGEGNAPGEKGDFGNTLRYERTKTALSASSPGTAAAVFYMIKHHLAVPALC